MKVDSQPDIEFLGAAEEQEIARQTLRLMTAQALLFAYDTPIKQSLANLAEFFAGQGYGASADEAVAVVDKALSKNPALFARRESDGTVIYVTSKRAAREGHFMEASEVVKEAGHTLKSRLYEPPPAPPAREVKSIAPIWIRQEEKGEEIEEAEPAEAVEEAPSAEAEAGGAEAEEAGPELTTVLEVAPGVIVDMRMNPAEIAARYGHFFIPALEAALEQSFGLISFGNEWYFEDLVERLGKNELRRIKDYIQTEVGEPLSDATLAADLFGKRPGDADFDATSFRLNYRLLREKRDFEFVGVESERLWSTTGLPSIGTDKRKPAEIGDDFRYLTEYPSGEHEEVTDTPDTLAHALTYYEYDLGVLPYDSAAERFFPQPLVEDQRSVLLHFEVPQLYVAFAGELRFPTGRRGGWIGGLDVFFQENLVPGATIVVSRTEQENRFILEFTPAQSHEERLLQYDERRKKYVFRPVSFACGTDAAVTLSETRFPRLEGLQKMDGEKRKPENILAAVFERVGEQVKADGHAKYWSLLDDLFPASNIDRPFSKEYLRAILESNQYPQFSRDPEAEGAYLYDPEKR